jgi:hypothetical protein
MTTAVAPEAVRLDDLTPAQRQLVLALIAARDKTTAPTNQTSGAVSTEVGHDHQRTHRS